MSAEKIKRAERCVIHTDTGLQRALHLTQRYFRISQEITQSFCARLWEKCDGSEYISTSSQFIVNAAELSEVTFQLRPFFWVFPRSNPLWKITFTAGFYLRTVIFCGYPLPLILFLATYFLYSIVTLKKRRHIFMKQRRVTAVMNALVHTAVICSRGLC